MQAEGGFVGNGGTGASLPLAGGLHMELLKFKSIDRIAMDLQALSDPG